MDILQAIDNTSLVRLRRVVTLMVDSGLKDPSTDIDRQDDRRAEEGLLPGGDMRTRNSFTFVTRNGFFEAPKRDIGRCRHFAGGNPS